MQPRAASDGHFFPEGQRQIVKYFQLCMLHIVSLVSGDGRRWHNTPAEPG